MAIRRIKDQTVTCLGEKLTGKSVQVCSKELFESRGGDASQGGKTFGLTRHEGYLLPLVRGRGRGGPWIVSGFDFYLYRTPTQHRLIEA